MLTQIRNGKRKAPRRVMLYGPGGIGKSTFGSMAPKPIFIQTEEGLGEIDCHSFPLSESFGEVMKIMAELHSEEHTYETLVVDSVDWLERLIWDDLCKAKKIESIEDIGYSKGYKFVLVQWRQFVEAMNLLRKDRGMMIILLAHAQIEKFEDPSAESYDRYTPCLHKHASAIIREWCDEVLFAGYKVFTKTTDEGFNRKKSKGIGSGERIIRTTERPSHIAKNRLNLPDEIAFTWKSFSSYLGDN